MSEEFTSDAIEDPENTIINEIARAGGIAIPAHIHLESGLIGRIKGGQAAKSFLEKSGCGILECPQHAIPDLIKEMLRGDPDCFALIDGSDAHKVKQIGSKPIWLKMDTLGLNGLRQIALEPLKRIQYNEPEDNKKLRILGIHSNGGTLKNQTICFNPELNCLIGGRGAGKSVVIDYLRFVFGSLPVDDYLKNRLNDRFADLIRNNTTVYALVSESATKYWLYERKLIFEKTTKGIKESTEIMSNPASIYRIILNPLQAIKLTDNLPKHKFEFYGQGEVQSITETVEPKRQLRLVDDFVQSSISQREDDCSKLEYELKKLEDDIDDLYIQKAQLEIEISALPEIESRIKEIEADLKANKLESHQIWEDSNNWINELYVNLIEQQGKLNTEDFTSLGEKNYQIPMPEANSAYISLISEIQAANVLIFSSINELKSKTETNICSIKENKEIWNVFFQTEYDNFIETLRKQGVENLGALNAELAILKSKKENINNYKIPEITKIAKNLKVFISARQKHLKNILSIWDEMSDIRIQAAHKMTEKLGNEVIIEIQPKKDLNSYLSFLDKNVPQGIRSKDDQLQKIIEKINPIKLAEYISERKIEQICEQSGVTVGTAEKLIEIRNKNVMQLEHTRCDDIATIYLVLEKRKKQLNDLSQGEKCTAILSVILLDEHSPLIVDQPEDELDHSFIMANVVDTLGKVKQKNKPLDQEFIAKNGRQFIIATHNQNIPVLGDAEMIIKMHKISGEDRCESECGHGIEHPDTIHHILSLEGGAEAFERRRRKYANQSK